jgi:acyl-CoA thioesterase superfamily protein
VARAAAIRHTVPPWPINACSFPTLQASAFGGLLARALEANAVPDTVLARLSFDLWRPVTRERLTPAVSVLRDGRKARTVEASLTQNGKAVARCTAVYLKADASLTPAPVDRTPPSLGPDDGRPIPEVAKRWSPFFTGVDTRTVQGGLLEPGPAACWFNLHRPLVAGETNSALVHRVGRGSLQRHLGGRESARSDVRQRRPHNRLLAAAACAVDLARRGNVGR